MTNKKYVSMSQKANRFWGGLFCSADYNMCGVLGKATTSLKMSFRDNAQNGKFYASLSLYLHVFKNSLKKTN